MSRSGRTREAEPRRVAVCASAAMLGLGVSGRVHGEQPVEDPDQPQHVAGGGIGAELSEAHPKLRTPPAPTSNPSRRRGSLRLRVTPAGAHGGARVLVVEDSESIWVCVLDALVGAGYAAGGRVDGAALEDILDGFCPELAVLDVMLPGGPRRVRPDSRGTGTRRRRDRAADRAGRPHRPGARPGLRWVRLRGQAVPARRTRLPGRGGAAPVAAGSRPRSRSGTW